MQNLTLVLNFNFNSKFFLKNKNRQKENISREKGLNRIFSKLATLLEASRHYVHP